MSQLGQDCILVVDDHADSAEMLRRFLTRAGYYVLSATTTADAMTHLNHCKLIISDVGTPELSGIDLMHDFLKHHVLRGIAISGYTGAGDEEAAHSAGFDRFLPKPVELGPLLAAVRALV